MSITDCADAAAFRPLRPAAAALPPLLRVRTQNLLDEATFYDKQWTATWDGVKRPSESEQ